MYIISPKSRPSLLPGGLFTQTWMMRWAVWTRTPELLQGTVPRKEGNTCSLLFLQGFRCRTNPNPKKGLPITFMIFLFLPYCVVQTFRLINPTDDTKYLRQLPCGSPLANHPVERMMEVLWWWIYLNATALGLSNANKHNAESLLSSSKLNLFVTPDTLLFRVALCGKILTNASPRRDSAWVFAAMPLFRWGLTFVWMIHSNNNKQQNTSIRKGHLLNYIPALFDCVTLFNAIASGQKNPSYSIKPLWRVRWGPLHAPSYPEGVFWENSACGQNVWMCVKAGSVQKFEFVKFTTSGEAEPKSLTQSAPCQLNKFNTCVHKVSPAGKARDLLSSKWQQWSKTCQWFWPFLSNPFHFFPLQLLFPPTVVVCSMYYLSLDLFHLFLGLWLFHGYPLSFLLQGLCWSMLF